jgi:GntR family transcriptional regulator of abcA and norABC
MVLHLDRTGGKSVYRQIVQHFHSLIFSGELPPGSLLPPERQLARELGVNRSTVSMAYDELRSMGLVRSVQGSGTRVSEDAWGLTSPMPDWYAYTSQGVFQPTLPLVRRIWEANRQPRNINFARGEMSPELWPTSSLQELFSGITGHIPLGYGDPRGEYSLRSAVSTHLNHHYGLRVSEDQILITAGAQQGLLLVTQSLLRPGDAVALEKPSYAYSLPLFTSVGLRMFPIPLDDQGLLPDEVAALYRRHKIRMVFISPTYQNPTGTTLPLERRRRLIEICSELRIPIVEDDAHGALTLDGSPCPPRPLASMDGAEQQVIYLGTLSKTFAPGLRVGWMTGPKSVIDRIAGVKEQMDLGVSGITQAIAEQVITTGIWEQNLQRLRSALTIRRNTMIDALHGYFGKEIAFSIPQGSYHIWGRLKRSVSDKDLVEAAILHGVVVVPGTVYGAEPGHVRLTYASSSESEIEEGVRRLHSVFTES